MRTRRFRAALLTGLIISAGGLVGCSDTLETGYEPRRLGASASERRGYYASPYTPEAAAAGIPDRTNANTAAGTRRPSYR